MQKKFLFYVSYTLIILLITLSKQTLAAFDNAGINSANLLSSTLKETGPIIGQKSIDELKKTLKEVFPQLGKESIIELSKTLHTIAPKVGEKSVSKLDKILDPGGKFEKSLTRAGENVADSFSKKTAERVKEVINTGANELGKKIQENKEEWIKSANQTIDNAKYSCLAVLAAGFTFYTLSNILSLFTNSQLNKLISDKKKKKQLIKGQPCK